MLVSSFDVRISCFAATADLMALTPEAPEVCGIPYMMDAYREEAEQIINS